MDKNRRDWLLTAASTALAAPAVLAAQVSDASGRGSTRPKRLTSEFLLLQPRERFRQAMRIQRSLHDQGDILHWYHFIMFAVPVGSAPRPIVRWEGIEFSRHEKIGPDRYRIHGHNLSFPRDLQTGRFIDQVFNPLIERSVPVPPMALTGDPGLIRSPEGVVTLDNPAAAPRRVYAMLRREAHLVKIDAVRAPPETWPVTFIEGGTEAVPARAFDDAKQLWLPGEVEGAYVFPWPAWMQMGDRPGHMFAFWSGHKLRTVAELPEEFQQRAQREFPQLLAVDRRPFARSLEDLAAEANKRKGAKP